MSTDYPGALDSFVAKTDGEDQIIYAAHVNHLQDAVVAIETELGTDPAGSAVDLKTRLAIMLTNAGGFKGPQQVKIVAKANGEYTTIQSAIDAIADATAAKPYVVLIFPGIYDETVTCKDHVHLVGQNPRSCKIDASAGYGLRIISAITTSISNLYIRALADEEYSLYISNGTVYMHNCIVESAAANYTGYITTGILHARNSQFLGQHEAMLDLRTNSTFKYCTLTSTALEAVIIGHASPQFYYCQLTAGDNRRAVLLAETDSNAILAYCKILKAGSATVSVDAANANTDAQIYHCSMNAALDGDVNNLIGTPYNVIDADLT